jgi:hypothetical protein
MATKLTIGLGPKDWDPAIGAWRCPTATLPGVKVAEAYVDGRRVADSDVEANADLGIVRWRGADQPQELTVVLASVQTLNLSTRADTLRWKRLATLLPFVGAIVGALLSSPLVAEFVKGVKTDPPWKGDAGQTAMAVYAKGGDAEALTGQWLAQLYDSQKGVRTPYKINGQEIAAETVWITGKGSLLTAATGQTNRKGSIWASGRVSPGNWVTLNVWSDQTDLVSVNLLKVQPDRKSMNGWRVGVDGNGLVRYGEITYTKLE